MVSMVTVVHYELAVKRVKGSVTFLVQLYHRVHRYCFNNQITMQPMPAVAAARRRRAERRKRMASTRMRMMRETSPTMCEL